MELTKLFEGYPPLTSQQIEDIIMLYMLREEKEKIVIENKKLVIK